MSFAENRSLRLPDHSQYNIRRKPVSNPNLHQSYRDDGNRGLLQPPSPTLRGVVRVPSHEQLPPALPPRPPRPPLRSVASANTIGDPYSRRRDGGPDNGSWGVTPFHRAATDIIPTPQLQGQAQKPQSPAAATVQKAYGEARHFLGGLISHPAESNRHFSILRHSPGVVFYRGSTTSVTISIFSDAPLSPDRSLWLQNKGWTGKTGMRAKAFLRLTDDWLDVTPTLALHANQVEPNDERAWQRDIAKFLKKASSRVRDTHRLRETVVARIPAGAEDGYFQVVLCHGPKKKVLCTSPVFRILSTSLSPSSVRGASLSTLPLEVGAMVMGLYAQATVQRVIDPVSTVVQARIDPLRPSWMAQTAAETAIGIGSALRSDDDEEDPNPAARLARGQQQTIYLEYGPSPPYPMAFKAQGTLLQQGDYFDSQKLQLRKIPDVIMDRLHGFFFGWARLISTGSNNNSNNNSDVARSQWYQIVLAIRNVDPSQQGRVNLSQVMKRVTTLRFLEEVELPSQTRVEVRVLGFLRPDLSPPTGRTERELLEARNAAAEAAMLAESYDVTYVQNVLQYPAWGPEAQNRSGILDRTKGGFEAIRARGQKYVESVPLHRLGVRSPAAEMRDRQITTNGFYIVR